MHTCRFSATLRCFHGAYLLTLSWTTWPCPPYCSSESARPTHTIHTYIHTFHVRHVQYGYIGNPILINKYTCIYNVYKHYKTTYMINHIHTYNINKINFKTGKFCHMLERFQITSSSISLLLCRLSFSFSFSLSLSLSLCDLSSAFRVWDRLYGLSLSGSWSSPWPAWCWWW